MLDNTHNILIENYLEKKTYDENENDCHPRQVFFLFWFNRI